MALKGTAAKTETCPSHFGIPILIDIHNLERHHHPWKELLGTDTKLHSWINWGRGIDKCPIQSKMPANFEQDETKIPRLIVRLLFDKKMYSQSPPPVLKSFLPLFISLNTRSHQNTSMVQKKTFLLEPLVFFKGRAGISSSSSKLAAIVEGTRPIDVHHVTFHLEKRARPLYFSRFLFLSF